MLARPFRVRKEDFKEIGSRGVLCHGSFATIRFLLREKPHSRFAVVVPKAVSSLSTKRNIVKRRVWAVIAEMNPKLLKSFDMIFFMKKGADKASFEDLRAAISIELIKRGVLKDSLAS